MDIIKIGMIGMTGVLIAIPLRNVKPSYGTYIALSVCLCIFFYIVSRLRLVMDSLDKITGYIDLSEDYIRIILKMIGVTYIAEFSSGICRDAGYGGIANQIEIFAKLSILVLSMPVVLSLLETISSFLAG
ncbi:MAG: stage III sporulation protein AD [Eubacterium sp.]|jgi:Stage III sporulation protein AC/AD protein family.|nr:stage III sporulation protein AD [Eubacterium sp.]